MKNLVLKEKQDFMGIKIPVIEGGFGEGQKVVLAKTVAEIHQYENGEKSINLLINRNIDRFDSNDLINLCNESFKVSARNLGFITSNAQKQCYLLSQRGYTKLVAMMDNSNDKKWDVMNNLIDDYFNMRNQLSSGQATKQLSAREKLELHYQFSEENAKRIDSLEQELEDTKNDFKEFQEDLPLIGAEPEELQKVVRRVGTSALGGHGSPAYKDNSLSAKVYKNVWKFVKEQFNVNTYKAIKRKHLSKAKEIAENYTLPFYLQEEIELINSQGQLNI
ncbi:hypothetical protein I9Y31_001248 [Clostridium perfringens]|nr:hypothetical protein [Clostridium perfringens]